MSPRISTDPIPEPAEPDHPESLEIDDYLDVADQDPAL
jgi:hypothetical protein